MRSGYVALPNDTGALRRSGDEGAYWSTRANTVDKSHDFNFDIGVGHSGSDARWFAFPLRCLSSSESTPCHITQLCDM